MTLVGEWHHDRHHGSGGDPALGLASPAITKTSCVFFYEEIENQRREIEKARGTEREARLVGELKQMEESRCVLAEQANLTALQGGGTMRVQPSPEGVQVINRECNVMKQCIRALATCFSAECPNLSLGDAELSASAHAPDAC